MNFCADVRALDQELLVVAVELVKLAGLAGVRALLARCSEVSSRRRGRWLRRSLALGSSAARSRSSACSVPNGPVPSGR